MLKQVIYTHSTKLQKREEGKKFYFEDKFIQFPSSKIPPKMLRICTSIITGIIQQELSISSYALTKS
jgi:hypothetical protein